MGPIDIESSESTLTYTTTERHPQGPAGQDSGESMHNVSSSCSSMLLINSRGGAISPAHSAVNDFFFGIRHFYLFTRSHDA